MVKSVRIICVALLAVTLLNFSAFFLSSVALGGDALNGGVRGGRYFLSSHGKDTEVNAAVWNFSFWHAKSVFLTHLIGAVAGAVLILTGTIRFDARGKGH